MKRIILASFICLFAFTALSQSAKKEYKKEESKEAYNESILSGLTFRGIGPAVTSGRISDLAVDPNDRSYYFVAAASGGVWKTTNGGITFRPVFDNEKSFSIGCVVLDPSNRDVVWVGSGENNSQRSVSWGDGIYKSTDGGNSWKNLGLNKSEHIGKIIIDPNNTNTVYVAAQGPLWGPGGDRGLYKTTDGGKTWTKSLDISENTGVTDIVMDPRNPNILYCASYQRRRHVWTMINGGPESAIYKSIDAGANWEKITNGLPSVDMGKIGLAISPVNPDIIYATIEAAEGRGGFFRSTNKGNSWEKRNDYVSGSAQYYQEIYCDPKNVDLVYVLDTYSRYTLDGGKSFIMLSTKERHVDDHAFFIDPKNTNYVMIGGDGGLYESYDRGNTWRYFENLPVTQFYRITADNAEPFYNVYGGTQDNNSFGGPAKNNNAFGVFNLDWIFVVGGDGYEPQIDPKDPNIVYGQWQYGGLVRYDKKSGESIGIKPQEEEGEELRWNWDTPLILSPHDNKRLYYASNKLFRSDDRGNSWKKISEDLSRQIKRDDLPVMGKIWGPEAVAKNASTSLYGNSIAISESPLKEDLLYVGTDDGLIQVTEDAGKNWRKIEKFESVPETTYVSDVVASAHSESRVFATFNNHKNADFKPYVLRSEDKGKTWTSISSNLPDNGPVWTIAEDHINPDILFVGTEYGVFFTNNGGKKWIQLKSGMPTIAVRDLEIQKRENDLLLGTFGRGIYILDNYSPLREMTEEIAQKDAYLFKIKDALMFFQDESRGQHNFGDDFFRAPNPAFGATFTYYIKDDVKTKKSIRKEDEKNLAKDNKPYVYPSFEQLKAEDIEDSPYLLFVIKNSEGDIVRMLKNPLSKGINRLTWDLRYPDLGPVDDKTDPNKKSGFPVIPGKYSVSIFKVTDNEQALLVGPQEFDCKVLNNSTLPAENRKDLTNFHLEITEMNKAVYSTNQYLASLEKRIASLHNAVLAGMGQKPETLKKLREIELKYIKLKEILSGDPSKSKRNMNQTPSINDRLENVLWSTWTSFSAPSQNHKETLSIASKQLVKLLSELKTLVDVDIKSIETELDNSDAPWTPGRFPQYKK